MRYKEFPVILGFTVILALLLGCAGQQRAPAEEQNYQKVFEVNLSKQKIYEETLQWMAESFVSSKAVIEYKNEKEGTIIGNGGVEIYVAIYRGYLGYTLKIEIKDKKYRVTTCCFRKADSTTIHPSHYTKRSTVEYARMTGVNYFFPPATIRIPVPRY
jgi:hypothetical protein